MENNWFVKNSFVVVSFVIPLCIIFAAFSIYIPAEEMRTKPTLSYALVGLLIAVIAWGFLVPIFAAVWTFCMRIIYGKDNVINYFVKVDQSLVGSKIPGELLIRKICMIALI